MGRLIDADAFEKFIKEKYKDNESTDDIKDQMLFDLSYQPTAYDVEKVVAELEKLKQHNKELSKNAYLKDDESFYFCAYTNFARAIEIVRKGGVTHE